MKSLPIAIGILCGCLIFIGCTTKKYKNLTLVWADEFDYTGLPDSNKWNYDTLGNTYGWGNNELQHYTIGQQKNVWVNGDALLINALYDISSIHPYTSARLTTKGKGDWLYGRIEVRAKMAGGRGTWPAVWMLPTTWEYGNWPHSGEIDIVEYVGYNPDSVFCTIHTGEFNHRLGTQRGKAHYLPQSDNNFHVYAINWNSKSIEFEIDGKPSLKFNNSGKGSGQWPFDKPFHLILNVAVGGDWGGSRGVDNSIFPSTMEVDYVRVYQKK